MKYSYAALSMIIVGMLAFLVVVVFQDITVNNEADYYSCGLPSGSKKEI